MNYPLAKQMKKFNKQLKTAKMNNQKEENNNFQKMNNHALIMRYNQELGNQGWTSSRAVFLNALQAEFIHS